MKQASIKVRQNFHKKKANCICDLDIQKLLDDSSIIKLVNMHKLPIKVLTSNAFFSFQHNTTANSVIRIKFANANYSNGNYASDCIFNCTCLLFKSWYAITNKIIKYLEKNAKLARHNWS